MTSPRNIIAIDLLRFACALLVVAFHYGAAFALAPSSASAALLHGLPVSGALARWTWFGWVGVELFFVISGIVIARSAEGATMTDFLRRRVLRLVPAAWLCASISFVVLVLAAPTEGLAGRYWVAMSFWPNGFAVDPSYWTLGIELFFYLVIATGLGTCGRFAAIERRALWIGSLSTAFWLAASLAGWGATPLMDYRPAQLLLLPHGCFFALGVTVHGLLAKGRTPARVMLLGMFAATGLAEIAGRTVERGYALGLAVAPWVPMAVLLGGVAVLLGSQRMQPWLARHVRPSTAVTLGLMTYPLYLLHQEVGAAIVAGAMRAGLPFFAAILLAFAIAASIAWWIARVAEPALRGKLAAALSPRRGLARDRRPSAFPPVG